MLALNSLFISGAIMFCKDSARSFGYPSFFFLSLVIGYKLTGNASFIHRIFFMCLIAIIFFVCGDIVSYPIILPYEKEDYGDYGSEQGVRKGKGKKGQSDTNTDPCNNNNILPFNRNKRRGIGIYLY